MAKKKIKTKIKKLTQPKKGKQSATPWVEVKGMVHDPEKGGFQVELDWNDAFIKELKKYGYTGSSDEALVQKWLAVLYRDIIEDMNKGKTSEFE